MEEDVGAEMSEIGNKKEERKERGYHWYMGASNHSKKLRTCHTFRIM